MSVRRRSITSRLSRDLTLEKGSHEFTRGMFEARGNALLLADKQIRELRGNLSLAEEGLAEIRDLSLTWALACPCDCEMCTVLFERIRDATPKIDPRERLGCTCPEHEAIHREGCPARGRDAVPQMSSTDG